MEDCEFPVLHDGFSPLEVILGTRIYSSDVDWDSQNIPVTNENALVGMAVAKILKYFKYF